MKYMILETYQSTAVLNILRKGEVYRANPSISFRGEYAAIIDMLGLHCRCPVFAVVKGRKQKTAGRVSASVKLVLDVPDDEVKLTEYGVWADFMYSYKFTRGGDYTKLRADCEEITNRRYQSILQDLRTQRPLATYKYPQAILEEIHPGWLISYRMMNEREANSHHDSLKERVLNLFRK